MKPMRLPAALMLGLALSGLLAQSAPAQQAAEPAVAVAVAPVAVAVAPAPIPFKRDGSVPAGSWSGGALGVVLVSLVAIGAVLYLRRRLNLDGARIGAPRLARVLETQRLGPRTLLSVIEFGGKQHLVVQGEHGVVSLATAEAPSTVGETT